MTGQLALVLHHHLPYIRHPEHPFFLEERWLFEAITETYLPLIDSWRRLEREQIPFCFTVTMTPPLASMLKDSLLMARYRAHLKQLETLTDQEVVRTKDDRAFYQVARFYQTRIRRLARLFEAIDGDVIEEYRRLQDAGFLEVITCTATHGFLPLMNGSRPAMHAQIELACREHARFFGRRPEGIWLAECGYEPGVDALLAEAGLRYFFVDTHGITDAESPPVYGVYAPLHCPTSGVAAFGRDPQSSRQVWSSKEGYPGDHDYREYYRDIGHDLDLAYIKPFIHPDGIRLNTGLKYHRITGETDFKAIYDPERAKARADEHAANFMFNRQAQVRYLSAHMDRAPIVVCPYDAELFGHWWFEGPDFLEALCRRLNTDQDELALSTPLRYLTEHPINQSAHPAASSWGQGGYSEFWCNADNEWIYRYLHQAAERMTELAGAFPQAEGLQKRALQQAARELLLAQASDWPFIMRTGTTVAYAVKRVRDHLAAFTRLYEAIKAQESRGAPMDQEWLASREAQWQIFPDLDHQVFAAR